MHKNFNKENIKKLNESQSSGKTHPYTCDGNGIAECKRTNAYQKRRDGENIEFSNDNEGVLIATENGWICPCGKYKQDWFH